MLLVSGCIAWRPAGSLLSGCHPAHVLCAECFLFAWLQRMAISGQPAELVSILQLPFVLTAEAKTQILHGEAMMRKQQEMESSVINVSLA